MRNLIEVRYGEGKVEVVRGKRVGEMWKIWVTKVKKRVMNSRGMLRGIGAKRDNVEGTIIMLCLVCF